MAVDFPSLSMDRYFPQTNDTSCANFAGTWKGNCTGGIQRTMTIEQNGCSVVKVDGATHFVGGLKSETTVIPGNAIPQLPKATATSITSATDWNPDKTQLLISGAVLFRAIGASATSAPVPTAFTGSYSMSGTQLVLEATSGAEKYSCTLDKQ